MRKYYLDNIRWITVVIVVLYHVIYMYNAEGIPGVCGKITDLEVQYFDVFQYIVYPWFMMLLFMVSGISSWLYLDNHSHREFISSRTTKLLVPSTIGLFAFQFLQGYVNVSLGDAVLKDPGIPLIAKVLICIASGVGVLWYIQLLWLFSMLLVLVRRIDRGMSVEGSGSRCSPHSFSQLMELHRSLIPRLSASTASGCISLFSCWAILSCPTKR